MATEVKLPRLGQGMESGTIVKWLKGEGEPVKKREPLYELDTDKVTQEVEAEADGVLLKIVVDSGEVEVGTHDRLHRQGGRGRPVRQRQAAPTTAEPRPTRRTTPPRQRTSRRRRARRADEMDDERERGRRPPRRPRRPQTAAVAEAPARPDGRVKASPLARRLAREKGIDIAAAPGQRPGGPDRRRGRRARRRRCRRRPRRPPRSPPRPARSRRSSSPRRARRSRAASPRRGRRPSSSSRSRST